VGSDRWRPVGALAIGVLLVGGGIWYANARSGTFWDDAADGDCIATTTLGPLRQLMGEQGYPRTPTVPCAGPTANYVVVAHTFDTTLTCPDGDKDVNPAGRIRIVGSEGRGLHTSYGWGRMCAAPVLHVGSCYSPGDDRGMLVQPQRECGLLSWKVTGRIDGAADIRRCSPATGLVLMKPATTYCETVAPLPADLRGNRFAADLVATPPPAG
jgi:hypothetical protein